MFKRSFNTKPDVPEKLQSITSGKQLVQIINSVQGYLFDHDEPETETEAGTLAAFFEQMSDYGDLMGMGSIDSAAQIKLG